MRTKIILWISTLFLLMAGTGCEKNEEKISSQLIGTWKLLGFGNSADNTLREAEPEACEKCYTLTFLSDGKITGHTSTNEIVGEYRIKEKCFELFKLGGTKINELVDGRNYVEALYKVHRFEIDSKQLKLFYVDDNFLLFNKK